MKIHAIETGTVRIKTSQRVGRGTDATRPLNVLLDREWTDPLPILAWAIETPEGVIVVDTGETARATGAGYFPSWHPYFCLAVRIDVTPEQEIGPQLRSLGIAPEDVRTVVLTHLHTDHAGGLFHFPKSRILASAAELALARGLPGRLRGYLPNRWPGWFAPEPVPFDSNPLGPFDRSYPLTPDGSVTVVPTPGHTPGHVSVVVRDGEHHVFLAGDVSYTQEAVLAGAVDGVSPRAATSLDTFARIRLLASHHPTIYLPTHDPESTARLEAGTTLPSFYVSSVREPVQK